MNVSMVLSVRSRFLFQSNAVIIVKQQNDFLTGYSGVMLWKLLPCKHWALWIEPVASFFSYISAFFYFLFSIDFNSFLRLWKVTPWLKIVYPEPFRTLFGLFLFSITICSKNCVRKELGDLRGLGQALCWRWQIPFQTTKLEIRY